EDGIRDKLVTGVQTCALPISQLQNELSQLVLQLRAMGIASLDWLDRPPQAAFDAATDLLDRLGVTPEMADLPLPPRLAKLVIERSEERRVGKDGDWGGRRVYD